LKYWLKLLAASNTSGAQNHQEENSKKEPKFFNVQKRAAVLHKIYSSKSIFVPFYKHKCNCQVKENITLKYASNAWYELIEFWSKNIPLPKVYKEFVE
jgi:hypothetical protein